MDGGGGWWYWWMTDRGDDQFIIGAQTYKAAQRGMRIKWTTKDATAAEEDIF